MSIATEISRLQTAKANIKSSIENKGVIVPSSTTLDGYATLIDSISTGGGGGGGGTVNLQLKTVNPSSSTQTVTPDSGYDGLSRVTVNPVLLVNGSIIPLAELIKTYSYDKLIVEDEGMTIPSYSTSTTTFISSNTIELVTLDFTNYDYFFSGETLTIPIYSISTKGKGREEYHVYTTLYECVTVPSGSFKAILNGTSYNTTITELKSVGSFYKTFYWSSSSALALYNGNNGARQTFNLPTLSGSVITIKSPAMVITGNATYLSSTYFNAITDIRYQYKIRLYRLRKGTYNIDGWGNTSNSLHIIDCANSNSHTLT